MNKLYSVVARAFEVVVTLLFAVLLFGAVAINSMQLVMLFIGGYVIVMGVWSALMLILGELRAISKVKV